MLNKKLTHSVMVKALQDIKNRKLQKVAGVIVFRKNGEGTKFLLLKHRRSHWDFSKGKVKVKESIETAARRELIEETGIKKFLIQKYFLETIKYLTVKKNKKSIRKLAFFYLARTSKKKITLSKEHKDYLWVSYREALKLVPFKNSKFLLKNANNYITKQVK